MTPPTKVRRNENGNVVAPTGGLAGPDMMAPAKDYKEWPHGLKEIPPGAPFGGLDPFQHQKGRQMGDFIP